jgi:hypothetical protein
MQRRRRHQVFPKNPGLDSNYRSNSGAIAILVPGGPPNQREMGDPMRQTMAGPGTTKYSEYSAMSVFAGDPGFQKNFAWPALPRDVLRASHVGFGRVVP